MFIADNWKDYEVLDTSAGEKLERWGDYLLIRPDPQVIWDTPKVHKGWKKPNAHYHRSAKGGGEWEFFDLPEQWQIHYDLRSAGKQLIFNLKPFSFKHTGVFPEQAVNWEWIAGLIKKGYGELGKGKCGKLRAWRCSRKMACGRLCEIYTKGDTQGEQIRYYYNGSPFLRTRSQG